MAKEAETIRVGQIVGAFGIKGEMKIDPTTDFLQRFDKGKKLLLKGKWVTIESCRIHKGRPLVKLTGVADANGAEALQWQWLEAPADDRPDLEDDEFMTEDLIGMEIWTVEGENLGELEEVLTTPAHDIFVVGTVMIPAVKEFVKMIDFDEDRITVALIPGMRNDEESEIA